MDLPGDGDKVAGKSKKGQCNPKKDGIKGAHKGCCRDQAGELNWLNETDLGAQKSENKCAYY